MVILFSYIIFSCYNLRVVGSCATRGLYFPQYLYPYLLSFARIVPSDTTRTCFCSFQKLSNESRRIRRIMSTVNNDRRSPHHNLLVNFHHSGYAAEQTIAMYSVPDAMVTERPLFEKNDGKFYSTNPNHSYIS